MYFSSIFFSIIHEDYEDTDAIIYSWGMAFWVPPVTTHTSCELDYSYWPWDIQKCNMVIGSWTKSGWEVDVFNMGQTDGTKNVGRGTHAGPKISPHIHKIIVNSTCNIFSQLRIWFGKTLLFFPPNSRILMYVYGGLICRSMRKLT